MSLIKKIIYLIYREYKISIININDLFINVVFFFLSIFIFIFAIGPKKEILEIIGIGIIWTLLLLSSTLSLRRYYQEDFNNGNLVIMHLGGLSYELIVILKIISNFFFIKIPFLISIPVACLIVNIPFEKLYLILLSFSIGSLILSCLGSIAAAMFLLNKQNFSLGSITVIIFSIPIIIFSMGIINNENNFFYLMNILFGILLITLAIAPWVSAACIKLAIQND